MIPAGSVEGGLHFRTAFGDRIGVWLLAFVDPRSKSHDRGGDFGRTLTGMLGLIGISLNKIAGGSAPGGGLSIKGLGFDSDLWVVDRMDRHDWNGDIVIVSHGAAIRLVSAVLAGVDASFVVDRHLDNTEAVV